MPLHTSASIHIMHYQLIAVRRSFWCMITTANTTSSSVRLWSRRTRSSVLLTLLPKNLSQRVLSPQSLRCCLFFIFSCSELRISRQLSRLGIRAPSSRSLTSNTDSIPPSTQDVPSPIHSNPQSPPPQEPPPFPHQVYGLYWLNDNSVAVVLSDRYDESKCRILAVSFLSSFYCSSPFTEDSTGFRSNSLLRNVSSSRFVSLFVPIL